MGRPLITCKQCGQTKKESARGICDPCYKAWLYSSYPEKHEKHKVQKKESYERNKDKLLEASRARKILEKLAQLGVPKEQYELEKSKGCVICGSYKVLCIDHDHSTMKYRGILCSSCNKGLGFFKDNIVVMADAIAYLLKDNNGQTNTN